LRLNGVEFDKINGCFVEVPAGTKFVNDICSDLLKEGYKIVFLKSSDNRVSVRHNIKDFHAGAFLVRHSCGGGHEKSAGMSVCADRGEMKKQIDIMVEDIYQNFPDSHRQELPIPSLRDINVAINKKG